MNLTIRYSGAEGILRSTDVLPGMLLIARLPPEAPGFAIDPTVDPSMGGANLRQRMDADLEGCDWVTAEEVVEGLADVEAATVLWKAMMATMTQAVNVALASFRLEEFESYRALALRTALALLENGYGSGEAP